MSESETHIRNSSEVDSTGNFRNRIKFISSLILGSTLSTVTFLLAGYGITYSDYADQQVQDRCQALYHNPDLLCASKDHVLAQRASTIAGGLSALVMVGSVSSLVYQSIKELIVIKKPINGESNELLPLDKV